MSFGQARTFDPKVFLSQTGLGRVILQYTKNKVIFAQGDPGDAVFYIQTGRAKLSVLSARGKEATIALLEEGASWGRGGLAPTRLFGPAPPPPVTTGLPLKF